VVVYDGVCYGLKDFGGKVLCWTVGSSYLIGPHEQMTVIIFEQFVMYMMVSGSSESKFGKNAIPGHDIFGMYQNQPVGIHPKDM